MAVVLCKSDVLRNAKLAPIILHGRKMMGIAPASCLNLQKYFGSHPTITKGGQTEITPVHGKDIKKGLLFAILKRTGLEINK